ncbi:MAG TPA: serine protease [Candidatus Binatia bacterium]|jgi:hypothetical protein
MGFRRIIKKPFVLIFILFFLLPSSTHGGLLTDPKQLQAQGPAFTWDNARSRSVKIVLQPKAAGGPPVLIGSGFIISPDGLFVTAYHVMSYCLENHMGRRSVSTPLDCSSEHPKVEYRALNQGIEYEIELVAYLTSEESTKSGMQSPEETIQLKDFVIGHLKGPASARFDYWKLNDFTKGLVDQTRPAARLELKPLMPPKKVFIAGYPEGRDFAIADGFLNLTEDRRRAYFAWNHDIYEPEFLEAHDIPADTVWGIRVENHMSGGAVIDKTGSVIGIVVNGGGRAAGVLSIENFIETFFSRSAHPGSRPALSLSPAETPLYLDQSISP